MRLVWTTAGYAALVNAENDGTNAVRVAQIALGRSTRAAAASDTALVDEIKRIDALGSQAVADNIIHIAMRDESADTYAAKEIGLISDAGVLLARYAQSATIIEKASGSTALLVIDATLTDVDATQIEFGGIEFTNPPATETVQGVIEIADDDEADAGEDDVRAMTPAKVRRVLPVAATTEKPGTVERATDAEAADGSDGERYITPKHLKTALPTKATTEKPGTVERATNDEADTGSDDERYMSPAKVKRVLPSPATTITPGLVERATAAEAAERQDDQRYVTPRHLPGPASESTPGLVERATDPEVDAGEDDTRYLSVRQIRGLIDEAVANAKQAMQLPVGSQYVSYTDGRNPATILGYGTWIAASKGRVTVGVGSNGQYLYNAGQTGGADRVGLTAAQNGPHSHFTFYAGDSSNPIDRGDTSAPSTGRNDTGDRDYAIGEYDNTPDTGLTSESGQGALHENRQSYETAYVWRRTA